MNAVYLTLHFKKRYIQYVVQQCYLSHWAITGFKHTLSSGGIHLLSLFMVFSPLTLSQTQSLLPYLLVDNMVFRHLSGFEIIFFLSTQPVFCLCFSFCCTTFLSSPYSLCSHYFWVPLALRVCRILQLPHENAQVILLILPSWKKKKKISI